MNGSAIWADNVINKAADNYINGRRCVGMLCGGGLVSAHMQSKLALHIIRDVTKLTVYFKHAHTG